MGLSEPERLEALLAGEPHRALWRYCRSLAPTREDAEDLLQECLATALLKLALLRDPLAFRGWIFTVARRCFLDLRRTRSWRERALYASADEPTLRDRSWLVAQWEAARLLARTGKRRGAVLALDEIQKVPGWSETVKSLWDEDARNGLPLRVVVLGSAPLLVQRGLTESLAGHWTYPEMRAAFGFTLQRFVAFGGYPGAAGLAGDPERWARHVRDALIETTISRDVLLLTRVDKPALLRQLFALGCRYSSQVLSYTKMLGQLHDAGNTTTLAHYLELLGGAGMLVGLQKYSGSAVRSRGSSPKLQVLNTALMTATLGLSPDAALGQPEVWGRLVESAVGAYLADAAAAGECRLHYWRDGNREVDFVVEAKGGLTAIEVKSGRRREAIARG